MANRVKLGIAFSGGGVRGASHLGFMAALHSEGIYPEVYVGTSAGAIVASLLAYGYTPAGAFLKFAEANQKLTDIAYGHILKGLFTKAKIEGVYKGNRLHDTLSELLENVHINDVPRTLGIISTEIDNGSQVIFSNQYPTDFNKLNDDNINWHYTVVEDIPLADVVVASSSIPGLFVPRRIRGCKLVDGGITNNLPSDVAWALGADKVISLDLGYSGHIPANGAIDILHKSFNILMERTVDGNNKNYGIYMNPEIYDVKALETNRINECFDRGFAYGKSKIHEIIKYIEE